MSLAWFNAAPEADATSAMLSCCESRAFAAGMVRRRPYPSPAAANAAIEAVFATLTWDDIREAMAGHPRIGDRAAGAAAAEQSGVTGSSRAALAAANRDYEERFGHIFLICATGLSGADMLASLRARLANNIDTERTVVTHELLKITLLRAGKMLAE